VIALGINNINWIHYYFITLVVASALALIGLVAYVPTVESSTWQRIYAIVFMLVFFGGVLCLVIYYLHKSEWYLTGTAATPYLTLIREIFVRK